jgi:hypothetical protein
MEAMNTLRDFLKIVAVVIFAVSCIEDSAERIVWGNGTGGNGSDGVFQAGGPVLVVSAGDESADNTRATLDTGTYAYTWDAGDKIKLSVTPVGNASVVTGFDKITLTATATAATARTNFTGSLSAAQYAELQEAPTFDFYSYFPNGWVATDQATPGAGQVSDANFPNSITFNLPGTYSGLTAGDFTKAKTPMVAEKKGTAPNIVYFSDELNSELAEAKGGIHFKFDHTTSYAAIEFDVRLFSGVTTATLNRIVMSGGASPADNMIWGTYTYDIATGAVTLTGGSHTITFTGGLTTEIGAGQVFYIPMPARDYSGQTLTFHYTLSAHNGSTGNRYESQTTAISGSAINFERGKIHPLLIAPKTAIYTTSDFFTVSKTGYYYIEAWGGDGGPGGLSDPAEGTSNHGFGGIGGTGQRKAGLYLLSAGNVLNVQVGPAGGMGVGSNTDGNSATGGSAGDGTWLGDGYGGGSSGAGGYGLFFYYTSGSGGGGGGAASGVLYGGTDRSNIILFSGGGGGGGGGGGVSDGGKGGDSNDAGLSGEYASGTYGVGGSGTSGDTDGVGVSNMNGVEGTGWSTPLKGRGGGGGGGGGGGYLGGISGSGGNKNHNNDDGGGAGGGAGGTSIAIGNVSEAGFTGIPIPRANPYGESISYSYSDNKGNVAQTGTYQNGCVVITFIKRD